MQLLIILFVPCEAALSAGFINSPERGLDSVGFKLLVDVDEVIGRGERHADVAVMVVYGFPCVAPL